MRRGMGGGALALWMVLGATGCGAVGVGGFAETGVASGATRARPACTRSALQAGLTRGTLPVRDAKVSHPFGCSGNWAYAAVNTSRFTLTSVFEVRGTRWVTASRKRACARGEIPRSIRKPACESN